MKIKLMLLVSFVINLQGAFLGNSNDYISAPMFVNIADSFELESIDSQDEEQVSSETASAIEMPKQTNSFSANVVHIDAEEPVFIDDSLILAELYSQQPFGLQDTNFQNEQTLDLNGLLAYTDDSVNSNANESNGFFNFANSQIFNQRHSQQQESTLEEEQNFLATLGNEMPCDWATSPAQAAPAVNESTLVLASNDSNISNVDQALADSVIKIIHMNNKNINKSRRGGWICPECNMWLSNRREIRESHLNSQHRFAKPFKCTVADCLESFSSKGARRNHIEDVHGEKVSCPECKKPNIVRCLKNHLIKLHGYQESSTYKCSCNQEFLIGKLGTHLKKYHKNTNLS